jgi:LmbE family N-acetylglucosaminyl deacetylase
MFQAQEKRRLGIVQHVPSERLRLLVVCGDPEAALLLRTTFETEAAFALEITPTASTAMRQLATHPYDLVAVDPAVAFGGFALLRFINDNYRWTATMVVTMNQEPQFLREAIACRVDGLLFRPMPSADFVEHTLMLATEACERRRRQQKRVLAIGAHPDDVEIGCGGALAKHHADYDVIHILTLSRGAAGGDTNIRLSEAHSAAAMIGAQLRIENLADTDIGTGPDTIAIIEAEIREMRATHIYTHSSEDTHQDHRAIHAATLVAARSVPNVYCYQSPSSTVEFQPHRFVDITHFIDKKIDLIGAYKSQVARIESMQPDVIVSTARYWGRFAGHVLAEPLQIVRDRDGDVDSDRPRTRLTTASLTANDSAEG